MSIYNSQICFVYKWTQISTGKWYIGSHTSKSAHSEDGYICGSKIVKPMIKEYPEDWTRIILETGSKEEILILEHEILKCLNAAQSEYSYNMSNGYGTFSNAGRLASNITRQKLSKIHKNRIFTDIHRKRISDAKIGIPKSEEHRLKLSISNIGQNKGSFKSEETKSKISKCKKGISIGKQSISICPYCNKSGGSSAMQRYHFDNCKLMHQLSIT